MKSLFLFILAILVATGYVEPVYSMGSAPRTELCRGALFPLAGITPTGKFDSKESLDICLKNLGTSAVAYQLYTNGKKAFSVTPEEAKSFNVYISNTYSVSCTDPRENDGVKNAAALPKLYTPVEIDMSKPVCIVSVAINNQPVRAVFSFDNFDKANGSAIFELTPEERKTAEERRVFSYETGCTLNFKPDGSPTPCFLEKEKVRRECPSLGKTCFDPSLAGVWISRSYSEAPQAIWKTKIPGVQGWIIRPDGSVRQLAIDFSTGKLAEGPESPGFTRVSYGCNGELYQEAHFFGGMGSYCGSYELDGTNLGISKTKSDDFRYFKPTTLGTKFVDPVDFTFKATLGERPINAAPVSIRLTAYARLTSTAKRRILTIEAFDEIHKITITVPNLDHAEARHGIEAGRVAIEKRLDDHLSTLLHTGGDSNLARAFVIDAFDRGNGRISGHFDYTVSDNPNSSLRFKGLFDIPLYFVSQ